MSQTIPPVIDKAISRLLFDHPFFATLALSTPVVMSERIPIAATDGRQILFNPGWVAENDKVADVNTVLVHEVGHNAFMHHTRREWRDPEIWGMAADYEINSVLKEQGFRPPPCGWLQDDKYNEMSAEKIYEELMKNPPPPMPGGGGDGEPQDGSEPGARYPMSGDLVEGPGSSDPAEMTTLRREQRQRVATAAAQAKMMGKLNGSLAALIDDLVQPKVPWHEVLREYMTRIFKDEESWSRRNRRITDYYLPTRHSERMGPIGIIGDSSGSIWCSPHELQMFASEIQAVADMVQPEHIRLVWADTQVADEVVFERGEPLKFDVKGGGGTDMRVPLKHFEQYEPEVVILLTDMYTPWPSTAPSYPLIICASTDAPGPDWAEIIRI